MIHHSDEAIIEGLRLRSDYIIKYIYQEYFLIIKFLVNSNGGYDEDAEDIFQDGLIIIYKKLKDNELVFSCSFKTFLYSICRNLWLQKLSKKNALNRSFQDIEQYMELPADILGETQNEENEKHRLIQGHFLALGEDCQKVLKLFMQDHSLKDVAQIMGYKTEKYAKLRKFLCKETLKKRILNDPKCQKFFDYD
jgi:RNA polymerase sigma factor (sigma-70 family)